MEDQILSDVEWEAELQHAMLELRRGEHERRKAQFQSNPSPWVI
ncbi:MAG: hypothetical protein AB7N76_20565 [Planctomycetota bacterium]